MKKVFNKIRLRNKQFGQHPITKNRRIKALIRYLVFNFLNQFKTSIKYDWIDDLKFYARKGDAGIVANIYYGLYEFDESIFMLHYLRSTDTFLYVGANIGHYSLLASGIKKCKTISIEPVPGTFERLKKQIRLNRLESKITALNLGVGNECSLLHFSVDKNVMNRIVDSSYPKFCRNSGSNIGCFM